MTWLWTLYDWLRQKTVWRHRRAQLARRYVPGETFIECCGTDAALVLDVDEWGDIEYLDLRDGHTGFCDAFHCGPVRLEPATAIALALTPMAGARRRAHEILNDARKEELTGQQIADRVRHEAETGWT